MWIAPWSGTCMYCPGAGTLGRCAGTGTCPCPLQVVGSPSNLKATASALCSKGDFLQSASVCKIRVGLASDVFHPNLWPVFDVCGVFASPPKLLFLFHLLPAESSSCRPVYPPLRQVLKTLRTIPQCMRLYLYTYNTCKRLSLPDNIFRRNYNHSPTPCLPSFLPSSLSLVSPTVSVPLSRIAR
ncbi:hypothetical protein F5B21DRAFT_233174 [Xylaria acuta]|nr:hypothetical protein F5B21DRAFT_233174 [Xylaria acuta]